MRFGAGSKLLSTNDSGAFPDNHQLIGGNLADGFTAAVCPANGQIGASLFSQAKMKTAIIDGVEAPLGKYFLGLTLVAILCGYA